VSPRKKEKAEPPKPKPIPKGGRTKMCVHRIPPESYCKRCDS
jgi:hypothetical protein